MAITTSIARQPLRPRSALRKQARLPSLAEKNAASVQKMRERASARPKKRKADAPTQPLPVSDLEFAKLDAVTPQAGLFRCLTREKAAKEGEQSERWKPFVVKKRDIKGVEYEFRSQFLLDHEDLKTLLVLCAMAQRSQRSTDENFGAIFTCSFDTWALVETKMVDVLTQLGKTDAGNNRNHLKRSLDRLGQVTLKITRGSAGTTPLPLLVGYWYDPKNPTGMPDGGIDPETDTEEKRAKNTFLKVRISPEIAQHILIGQGKDKLSTRVSMVELNKVEKNERSFLLCSILSACVGFEKTIPFTLDELVEYTYGSPRGVNPATLRKRVERIRKALTFIDAQTLWQIRPEWEHGEETYYVTRPNLDDTYQWEQRQLGRCDAILELSAEGSLGGPPDPSDRSQNELVEA